MYFDLTTINNIITISKGVLGNRISSWASNNRNGIKKVNDKGETVSNVDTLLLNIYIEMAEYRQSEIISNTTYQLMISKLFYGMSLQPEYYTYTGGTNVINSVITPPGGNGMSYQTFKIPLIPTSGTTILPVLASDQANMVGATEVSISREGLDMQSFDNTRPDYFSFNSTTGQVTINTSANGSELFIISYQKLMTIN